MDTQELMKMITKMDHMPYIDSFTSSSLATTTNEVDQKSSIGFMDMLGFQDYYPSSIFDANTTTFDELELPSTDQPLKNEDDGVKEEGDVDIITTTEEHEEETSSVVLSGQQQQALSPNSSNCISSSPAHQLLHKPNKQSMKAKKATDGNETKTTKKKKEKEARFAFMTRTEIDHLDDGYRWRKYGQKAVKNSHFPRSYYRCTNASCNVKKRVERCMNDPSYVVTTYEGQHTHPVNSNSAPLIPSFNHLTNTTMATAAPPAMLKLDQGGLLQDMMFCHQQQHH